MSQIAIAGAGVAGLASAILLQQQGRQVSIFDHVADPTPVGAGILLQPSGQAVMQGLGLLDKLRTRAAVVESLIGYSGRWRTLDLHYEILGRGVHGLGVHRAQLHQILWQRAQEVGVEFHLGHAVENFVNEGAGVEIHTGQFRRRYDALIIANGTRSRLRNQLSLEQSCEPYPWGAYWAVLDKDDWPFPQILMQRYRGAHIMMGVLPTGINPVSGRPCYSLFWSVPRKNFVQLQEQGMPGLLAQIQAVWPEVASWLASVPETPIAIAEYADVRLSTWNQRRVVVIGDAAHAMSPQLGQGANIALIDAWILAQSLQRHEGYAQAFEQYSVRRKRHIRYYQFASRIMTPLYQSHYPVAWLRDLGTVIGRHLPPVYRQYLHTLCGAKQGLLRGSVEIAALLDQA